MHGLRQVSPLGPPSLLRQPQASPSCHRLSQPLSQCVALCQLSAGNGAGAGSSGGLSTAMGVLGPCWGPEELSGMFPARTSAVRLLAREVTAVAGVTLLGLQT